MTKLRTLAALATVAVLGFVLLPAGAGNADITVLRHTTQPLPSYGALTIEVWTNGTEIQIVGLDTAGKIMLVREGALTRVPSLEGTGALDATLPAQELSITPGGRRESTVCETKQCAQRIARKAESIARAARLEALVTPAGNTTMTSLCPALDTARDSARWAGTDRTSTHTQAPATLCRWVPMSGEDRAALDAAGGQGRVQIGETVFMMRHATWSARHSAH